VQDDEELELFDDVHLRNVEQVDHLDWATEIGRAEVAEVHSFVGPVNHAIALVCGNQQGLNQRQAFN
jgi:hypothetical protein